MGKCAHAGFLPTENKIKRDSIPVARGEKSSLHPVPDGLPANCHIRAKIGKHEGKFIVCLWLVLHGHIDRKLETVWRRRRRQT